ncbi:MAG: alpha/beta hydrolase [Bacteroidales bacterium]|nr:alpha/beta hydrolase [Bacteroidales bacterium]
MMIETKKLEIIYYDQPLQIEYFLRRGQKETVLYLHGLGCSKSDFLGATEIESLQAHTLVAFDFPGHGNSSYSKKLDMDDLVEITNLFAEKLNLHDIVLIGHSMGGLVALLFSEKYARKVKAFINVEGNLKDEDCFFSRQVTAVDFDTFLHVTFRNFKFKLQISKNPGFKKCAETLGKYQPQKAMYDYSPSLVRYSDSGTLIEKFTSLRIPKYFIHGSENRGLSYIPELIQKGLTVSEISNSNHFPQYDNPKEFHTMISNFLEKCKRFVDIN